MSERKAPLVSHFEPPHVSLRSYVVAFVTCVVLTLAMYFVGISDSVSKTQAFVVIGAFAVVQAIVQLRKFLHLGEEFRPRWKLIIFAVMLSIILIVVIGTVWIMDNLNYRMMHSTSESQEYVQSNDGL